MSSQAKRYACDVVRHDFLDHTGETVIRLRADTAGEVFSGAAVALGELARAGIPSHGGSQTQTISLEAADRSSLLVDWLNELIFLSETGRAVPVVAFVRLDGPTRLNATVTMLTLSAAPSLVKAATHHGVRFEPAGNGWMAEVTLDV